MPAYIFAFVSTSLIFVCVYGITALGGLFSERSGVVNLGLEGFMGFGALVYALIGSALYNKPDAVNPHPSMQLWVMLVAFICTGAFGVLHAWASITLRADQVIVGTAINLIMTALVPFIFVFVPPTNDGISFNNLVPWAFGATDTVGGLFSLPIVILAVAILATILILRYTQFGFWLRAAGENPHALAATGKNVALTRYIAVCISAALAGLGGIIFIQYLQSSQAYKGNMEGSGFIAIAILVFGQWKISFTLIGAVLFSFLTGLSRSTLTIDQIGLRPVPSSVIRMFPFFLSLLALILFSRWGRPPAALGQPYVRSQR